ncbi:Dynein light chain-related protein [Penicillium griseofulvum]|uniref:Dynein light chain-related protein n=1 Tax=Penicillium patulum TaxID=5078 RepID=A0A135LZM6_PENPA|nr:Dynein light chain-related protein [Penicillium griseofulvum]KXG54416.1 Dynein light chain-related protein [Penicillium griseofulvum]
MANSGQRTQQVPQHVTALLSHLTSRPGVQSTLILSRKDGSIIQSTGQLAQTEENASRTAHNTPSTTDQNSLAQSTDPSPTQPAVSQPYQPSQAETLAAHIFAYVSSAEALGVSLSRPTLTVQRPSDAHWDVNYDYGNEGREEDRDDGEDRDEDGEVKLLRMRTKKHEIVVVPDRKYLLCVVHDASPGGGPAAASRSR